MTELPEGVERYVPPRMRELTDQAVDLFVPRGAELPPDVQRLRLLIEQAYEAGRRAGEPYVSADPAMRFGQPCVNNTRLPVESVAGAVWAGASPEDAAEEYGVTRADVIVACWYAGTYGIPGSRGWKKRWGAWAESVHGELWHSRYDVPDPPDRRD